MSDIDIPRPTNGDVVELHPRGPPRSSRTSCAVPPHDADREAARTALAEVLIAHGESEEETVYPELRRKRAITAHELEHSEEEHAEGNEALLALLECKGTDTQKFDDASRRWRRR